MFNICNKSIFFHFYNETGSFIETHSMTVDLFYTFE